MKPVTLVKVLVHDRGDALAYERGVVTPGVTPL